MSNEDKRVNGPCSKCGHLRVKHQHGKCDDSSTKNGVFHWRPCSCAKWVKSKVKR